MFVFHIVQTVASPLRLELFHDVQKVIVDLRLVAKLQFDLVQIGQSIFHLEVKGKRRVNVIHSTCSTATHNFSEGVNQKESLKFNLNLSLTSTVSVTT